jgi:hypothetical protein
MHKRLAQGKAGTPHPAFLGCHRRVLNLGSHRVQLAGVRLGLFRGVRTKDMIAPLK